MLPYFALFGFFAVPAVTTATKAAGARDRGLWLGALVLILAIGLRLEVGGDWYVYLRLFRGLQTAELGTVLGNSDPAYSLVSWTVAQLGLRIWAVNLVCAAIFTYGLISLARLQPNPWLALLVSVPYLVIVVAMGYTRQSAALGLLMVALSHQVRGNPLRMIVSLLIAAAFHKSAVITIPLVAIAYSGGRLPTLLSLILLAAVTYYLFLSKSTGILVANYFGRGYNSSGAAVRIAMNAAPAILLLGFRNQFGFDRQQLRLWVVFSLASLAALAAFFVSPSSTAVDRLALYLIPLQIVVLSRLPEIGGKQGRSNLTLVAAVVAYSLAVQVVWLSFGQFSWAWLPYRSYLWAPSGYVEHGHRE